MPDALHLPHIIIVLAAEPYVSPGSFANFDEGMYLGGQLRFDAAARLAATGSVTDMVLLGGYNRDPASDPLKSDRVDDMADYIRPRRHPSTNLTLVPSLYCTHHNFVALGRVWESSSDLPRRIGILSNAFHLKRSLEFAVRTLAEMFPDVDIELVPIEAEAVLGISVEDVVSGHESEYQTRLTKEARGLQQIYDGTYQDVCFGKLYGYARPLIDRRGRQLLTDQECAEYLKDTIPA